MLFVPIQCVPQSVLSRILWKEIKSSVKCMRLLRLSWHFKTIWMCLRHSRDTKEQTRLLWVLVSSKHSEKPRPFYRIHQVSRTTAVRSVMSAVRSLCYIRFVCEIKRHEGYCGAQKPQITPLKNTCFPPECNFQFVHDSLLLRWKAIGQLLWTETEGTNKSPGPSDTST
jgi:hypothetical protein